MENIKNKDNKLDDGKLTREERILKWRQAGIEARKRNKEKRDAEREEHRLWLLEHPEEAAKEREEANRRRRGKHKRRGRPKKRGPKKKRRYVSRKPKVKHNVRFDYKIVAVLNGRQKEYIGRFYSLEMAYEKFRKLENANSRIVFRRKVINAGVLKDSRDEYLLLQKNRTGDLGNTMLRNQYGKLVEQISSNPEWIIYDKCDRWVEETFWVYGHCPKTDRKTFQWIFDNMVVGKLENPYDIERVLIYKNKVVIKHDDGEMGIIICKNISDAIRFYDLLEEWCRKQKQVFFIGSFDRISDRRRDLEAELMEYTGWPKTKIQRDSTRA